MIVGLAATTAGLAIGAFGGYRAWLHWQAVFPFGPAGFCGQLAPHCGWCAVAVMGVVLAGVSAEVTRRLRQKLLGVQVPNSVVTARAIRAATSKGASATRRQ